MAARGGHQAEVAAEHGAVGCIYSPPPKRRFLQGDVYPKAHGAARTRSAGSCGMRFSGRSARRPGPHRQKTRTPGYKKRADPYKITGASHSYSDALPMLRNLDGRCPGRLARRAPSPITLAEKSPPSTSSLRSTGHQAIYNVSARLRGSEAPDQWVIAALITTAWVNGADDPISGLVALRKRRGRG